LLPISWFGNAVHSCQNPLAILLRFYNFLNFGVGGGKSGEILHAQVWVENGFHSYTFLVCADNLKRLIALLNCFNSILQITLQVNFAHKILTVVPNSCNITYFL